MRKTPDPLANELPQSFKRESEIVGNMMEVKTPELDVHLVMDNYGTHKPPSIKAWFARHARFRVHFAPTSASWLNQVERWLATLTEKYIRRATHRSTRQVWAKSTAEFLTNDTS